MHQYQLDASAPAIGDHFRASIGQDVWEEGTVNALSPAPVITARPDGKRMLRPFFWGYPPPKGGDAAVLTVRNLESPFWIGNLRHVGLRCLVPATSFTLRAKGRAVECGVVSGGLFAFAGIWKDTTDYPAFAIVTTDANRALVDRGVFSMPVILDAAEQAHWLTQDWRQAQKLVESYPSQLLRVG
ncbi:DUF159 family protein [Pseudonocardia sp. TMWB2A]|uniref:SOS response-associated peptidase family protein n=1 Tax=Pseudonocardia sp. TMWB2A TaxID=687430 RepID=UPI00307D1DE3